MHSIDDFNSCNCCMQPTWVTQCPLLLLDTRMPYGSLSIGCEEHLDPAGTGSFFNEGEADIVVQHVFSLIYSGTFSLLLIFSANNNCRSFNFSESIHKQNLHDECFCGSSD